MRSKENLEIIYKYVNDQTTELDKIVLGGMEGSTDTKTLAKRYLYHDMLYFINLECNAANYLVDRVCRTSWNLTDQYISAIIEVAMRWPRDQIEKDANEHDTRCFLRQSARRHGRRSLSLSPKQSNNRLPLSHAQSLRSRKGKSSGAHRRRRDPDQDTDSQEELNEEDFQEKTEKPRKLPDLRTLKMGELRQIARDLGCSKAEIDTLDRWPLVNYIERHGKNEYEDLYRPKKRNQQELNQDFQIQVNQLFREQCERLSQTTQEQFISTIKVDLSTSFPIPDLDKQILDSPSSLLPFGSQPPSMDLEGSKSGYKGRSSEAARWEWVVERDFDNYTPFHRHRIENGK